MPMDSITKKTFSDQADKDESNFLSADDKPGTASSSETATPYIGS